jgi:hypothetical protein
MRRHVGLPVLGAVLLAIGLIAGAAFGASDWKTIWTDPNEGLSYEDRLEEQQANSEAFWRRYAAWLEVETEKGRDPSAYPATGMLATFPDPAPRLSDAISLAKLVVVGEVSRVSFNASGYVVAEVSVVDVPKGEPIDVIEVALPSRLMPQDDDTWAPVLVEAEAIPTLNLKDSVVLFLDESPVTAGSYEPLPWTGVYRQEGTKLVAVPGNPFATVVEAMSADRLASTVRNSRSD